ncbi:DUF3047 domain-containing protein [Rhodohalobacter sp.]|uniref:DUF3047 domain-containing protein n=1 Tax=Rhodohalobacter sp. TaxID=1974210 RepID=UPI002ACD9349|nr:DUF3047 domain-containing protein [Rhodohalobacter sp.]MDZ7755557.1 DUF3047 domain-containing protein [Rhodohalobacter sp.]
MTAKSLVLFFIPLFLLLGLTPLTSFSQEPIRLNADSISQFILDPADFDPDDENAQMLRHEPFGRKKEAVYERDLKSDGSPVIKATSTEAISSVTTSLRADPFEFSYLEWEWKIEEVLEYGDLTQKDGDDFVARIYVTFDYPVGDLPFGQKIKYRFFKTFTSFEIPLRSLNYVWASKEEVGTVAESPFTSWVQYFVVNSGNENAQEWISLKRNIVEDYRQAFGEEPREITGITIMTDSDNTGESTKAWFGKIMLSKE